MSHSTLITSPERRRRWRLEDKLAVVSVAFSPGAVVTDVARRYEVSTSLIYKWRRQAMVAQTPAPFVPAMITGDDGLAARSPEAAPAIVVELAGGGRVRIASSAPAALVSATLRALR
jgi:transposase